jgi:hypothetical protein
MPAAKSPLTERVIKRALCFSKNNWTPMEAAEWSGIRYRTLLRLLKEGMVPTIPIGAVQHQNMGKGKRRRRACTKYLIPRVSFMRWFENIGAPDPSTIGKTAA